MTLDGKALLQTWEGEEHSFGYSFWLVVSFPPSSHLSLPFPPPPLGELVTSKVLVFFFTNISILNRKEECERPCGAVAARQWNLQLKGGVGALERCRLFIGYERTQKMSGPFKAP